jgi:GNAT superfamily N-acetyltransferase
MIIKPSVRPIHKDDAKALASLAEEFEQYLNSLKKGRNEKAAMTYEVFLRDGFGQDPAFNGLLVESGSEALGYLLYHYGYISEIAARTIQVIDLYVKKTARSAGVGTQLMQALIPICQEIGATLIYTSVWKLNKSASMFYQKLGAELVEDEIIVWWSQEQW